MLRPEFSSGVEPGGTDGTKKGLLEKSRNRLAVLRVPRSLPVHGREARESCCRSSAAGVSRNSAGSLPTIERVKRLTARCTCRAAQAHGQQACCTSVALRRPNRCQG